MSTYSTQLLGQIATHVTLGGAVLWPSADWATKIQSEVQSSLVVFTKANVAGGVQHRIRHQLRHRLRKGLGQG